MRDKRAWVFSMAWILALLSVTPNARASDWTVDKAHSRIGFSVSHLGINTVHGVFKNFSATVSADDAGKLSSVSAEVSVASVDTGIDGRDDHLRASEVFNVAKYPTMRLETTRIVWNGNRFSGTARLTIKDKTLPIEFKGKLTGTKRVATDGKPVTRAGYSVTATVNRKAFGIGFGGFSEGLGMVGETVNVALDVELVRPE